MILQSGFFYAEKIVFILILALAPVLCCFCFLGCHGNVPLSPQASPCASSPALLPVRTFF